ncbi:MAG: succinylglutamate desuccinylase/aspartoacylase family protein [Pseudomonadales bacterium]|nr:succinylglutamate desuccinylase/aspartoacylase family protein [Pseudomonadales bacterium]
MTARRSNADFELAGTVVRPGERRSVDIPLAPLVTHNDLAMTANVLTGHRAGPTLLISAAIHGDEINGVEIIRRLMRHPAMAQLRGTLVAIPVVNVHGFLNQTRYLPDGRDLNRSFPGSSQGSLAARVADKFVNLILSRCDYAIDLHTGARHRTNLPQIRVDLSNEASQELGIAFGVPVLMHSRLRDGSLREEAASRGIPFLLYEGGESLRFDEFSIRVGVNGILNVMRHLGMLRHSRRRTPPEPFISRRSVWVRAGTSGVMRTLKSIGAKVTSGDLLGIVGDPMGNEETGIHAPEDGIVIGRLNLPLVNEGDAVFHIACYRERTDDAGQAITEWQAEIDAETDPSLA